MTDATDESTSAEPSTPSPAPSEGATIARRAGVVGSFTFLSRIAGAIRDAVMAGVFGAGAEMDAFVVAQTIPNVLRRLVAEGSLMIAFVPLLGVEKTAGGVPAMRRFSAAVLGAVIPLLLVIVGAAMLFPEVPVKLMAGGFDPARAELAATLTRWMMPFLLFVSLTAVASGALNVQGVFGPPAAAPILLNLVIIVGLAGASQVEDTDLGIQIVAVALTLGGGVQLLLQVPYLARVGLLVAPRWEPSHPTLRTLGARMLPAVFGVAVYQLNIVVIRLIGSLLEEGQLSCYYSATRLQEFALGVFAVSISIAALPTLSEHAARGDREAMIATYRRALRATNFITIPSAVGLYLLAEPIVGVVFTHGRFSVQSAVLTADLLRIMAAALIPIGLVRVTVPTYYALGDTKTPVRAAMASLVTTGFLGVMLLDFEIRGLTWATFAGAIAQVLVLSWLLSWQRVGGSKPSAPAETDAALTGPDRRPSPPASVPDRSASPSVLGHAGRCLASIVPAGGAIGLLAAQLDWLEGGKLVRAALLLGLIGFAVVGYGVLGRLLRIPEIDLLWSMVRRRILRRR